MYVGWLTLALKLSAVPCKTLYLAGFDLTAWKRCCRVAFSRENDDICSVHQRGPPKRLGKVSSVHLYSLYSMTFPLCFSWPARVGLAHRGGGSVHRLSRLLQGESDGGPGDQHRAQRRQCVAARPPRPQPVQQHRLQRTLLLDRVQSDEAWISQCACQGKDFRDFFGIFW